MLKDCLEIFKNIYDIHGDSIIMDGYILGEGTYVLVKKDGTVEILEIQKKENNFDNELYYYFAHRDYLSKLLDMNKPIDSKKIIHSNNYLSLFIKKENLNENKLSSEVIENYYYILQNPRIKYKDKNKRNMYEEAEKKYGTVIESNLIANKIWIQENIFSLVDKIKNDKNYLKIFFEEEIDVYMKESYKYITPNIYNCTDYNITVGEVTYGLPNNNIGLNSKKPFLEQKTRKNKIPYYINEDEVLLQKKFFDYLMNNVSQGKKLIYLADDINSYENGCRPTKEFNGYFLRLQKGKEVEIHDYDTIVSMNPKIPKFKVDTVIELDYNKCRQVLNYNEIEDIADLEKNINDVFFNKFLMTNYFTDIKDIKLNDTKLKEILVKNRELLFTWFYKGRLNGIESNISKFTKDIIKISISNGFYIKASEQYNLRCSLLKYLNKGEDMGGIIAKVKTNLRVKINTKETLKIENDEEYYFAIGQVASYLISLNKSSTKPHSIINPIINSKDEAKLKKEIKILFKKYNYLIRKENKRFNNMYSMVLEYQPRNKVNEDVLLAGYLNSNLMYEKR